MSFKLRPESMALAIRIQEAANSELTSDDVSARLRDAIADKFRGSGDWGYLITYIGDAESGDVIYSHSQDTRRAGYTISGSGDTASKCDIDFDGSSNVVPRTIYEQEADEADNIASMEALKTEGLYTEIPLYERFIGKAEREAADKEDFAGKGTSFPILKPGDIMAAVRSLGRAGAKNNSTNTIKARIIAIAKRKGWTKYLPKAWNTTEAAPAAAGPIKLSESIAFAVDMELREAFGPEKRIKIIAPGKGSSAFYPAEVLKRDGPKVFKAGTPMRIDHPTRADEASRPEGSVKDWGAVLSENAVWLDDHAQGAGLYAAIRPFSDSAQFIDERAPYAGVSIRASGEALHENGKPVMREGVPVLASFTSAEGVDMVTRAGAGGMFLSESARTDPTTSERQVEMDEAKVKELVEAAIKSAVAPYRERAVKGDATAYATRVLAGVSLTAAQKQFVIEESLKHSFPMTGDALDEEKFGVIVIGEAKRLAALFGGGEVRGLGVAVTEAGKMKACPDCGGDDEDCGTCDGTGKVAKAAKSKESLRKSEDEADKDLAADIKECSLLGLSEAGALRAVKGRK